MNKSMDKMKRKSSVYSSSNKKFRSNLSINCIENLSNELFHEIFDYLDAWDIHCAFSNLNGRFQQLLDSPSILYKIKLIDRSIANETLIYNWVHLMCLNRKQIFSIQLFMELEANRLISPIYIDSSLQHLQSLVLIEPEPKKLVLILGKLIHLPHLCSLTIEGLRYVEDLTPIYRLILALPMLTYYKISTEYSARFVSLPISTQPNRLEHLFIDHSCTFNDLSVILSYTPQLRRLSFMESNENAASIQMIIPLIPIHLTYLSVHVSHVTFDEFEIFIRQLPTKLKVLMFSTSLEEIAYIDAHRWERFLQQDLPQLEKFSLQYHERNDDKDESNIDFRETNPFFSSFWLKRQCTFEIEPGCEHIVYSIRPYKKRWFEQPNVDNTTIELIKSIRLSISYISLDEYYDLVIRDITTILGATPIHHLEISEKQVLVDILIQITNVLPQVTTMKIHSLSLDQAQHSETEELLVFPSTTSTNQITKIYLEKMSTIDEVYALMKHYPNMSYLKIDSLDNMKVNVFIRNLLKKINGESNRNLRLLCFRAPTTDDLMIKTLEKMKKEKKWLNDYTINRFDNYLCIQWK